MVGKPSMPAESPERVAILVGRRLCDMGVSARRSAERVLSLFPWLVLPKEDLVKRVTLSRGRRRRFYLDPSHVKFHQLADLIIGENEPVTREDLSVRIEVQPEIEQVQIIYAVQAFYQEEFYVKFGYTHDPIRRFQQIQYDFGGLFRLDTVSNALLRPVGPSVVLARSLEVKILNEATRIAGSPVYGKELFAMAWETGKALVHEVFGAAGIPFDYDGGSFRRHTKDEGLLDAAE